MDKDQLLIQLQIESLTNLISSKKTVNPYQVFPLRNQLRLSCQGDPEASEYLEKIIIEAEVNLQNILNFYPHIKQ